MTTKEKNAVQQLVCFAPDDGQPFYVKAQERNERRRQRVARGEAAVQVVCRFLRPSPDSNPPQKPFSGLLMKDFIEYTQSKRHFNE